MHKYTYYIFELAIFFWSDIKTFFNLGKVIIPLHVLQLREIKTLILAIIHLDHN